MADLFAANDIHFEPGLNEELAATAIWGAQQAELRGEGRFDGVFGLWYGKGPGVDRSGDVFRHANLAGTSRHGGVLALMGDDPTAESSTTAHQSEFAFLDAMMPVLSPAGVQEILDYGALGWALSRYAGVWVGLKCIKDTVESTAVVDASLDRVAPVEPTDFPMPPGGLNIRRNDGVLAQEARLHEEKRAAVVAWLAANRLNRIVASGGANPKIGVATIGKSYLDVRQALDDLGIDEARCDQLGLRLYKLGCAWPIEPAGLREFAAGLSLIVVVEEKRTLIEAQIREELYGAAHQPVVVGKRDEAGQWLFPAKGALDPNDIAIAIGERLLKFSPDPDLEAALARLRQSRAELADIKEAAVAHALFLLGLPAQSFDRGARRRARLCRHRLPFHGAVHGPQHRGLHPDGRRGRQLGRRIAVLQATPCLPESRRRHLQSFRRAGAALGDRRQGQRHLQDPVQRRRGDDRRPAPRRRAQRSPDRASGHGRRRQARRRRRRRRRQVSAADAMAAGRQPCVRATSSSKSRRSSARSRARRC